MPNRVNIKPTGINRYLKNLYETWYYFSTCLFPCILKVNVSGDAVQSVDRADKPSCVCLLSFNEDLIIYTLKMLHFDNDNYSDVSSSCSARSNKYK